MAALELNQENFLLLIQFVLKSFRHYYRVGWDSPLVRILVLLGIYAISSFTVWLLRASQWLISLGILIHILRVLFVSWQRPKQSTLSSTNGWWRAWQRIEKEEYNHFCVWVHVIEKRSLTSIKVHHRRAFHTSFGKQPPRTRQRSAIWPLHRKGTIGTDRETMSPSSSDIR